jgi:formate dehydrogenase subunit gamma
MGDTAHRRVIARYTERERVKHWLLAIAFVLAALSGLALFHPAFYWMSSLVGGGTWSRILHPFIGLVMTVAFALLALAVGRHNRMEERDWQWLRQMRSATSHDDPRLPEVGRYNGGQKILFKVLLASMVLLLLSGIVIWRSYFSAYFPIGVIRLAAVVHALAGFVLVCSIIGHVYAAIFWVTGSMRAMTRGDVTPGWAWRHHRAWFRESIRATNPRTRTD